VRSWTIARDVAANDAVAVVRDAVRVRLAFAQPDRTLAADVVEVHDALAALADDGALADIAERLQQPAVEREAALEVGDDEVEVVDTRHGRAILCVRRSRAMPQDHRSLPPDQNAADVLGRLAGAP
jgi:hypothetical protein